METLQHFLYSCLSFFFQIISKAYTVIADLADIFHIQTISMYIIIHVILGFLGVLIYKYGAEGPANPQGESSIERDMFWFILWMGPVGLIMSLIAMMGNLLSKIPDILKKERIEFESQEDEDAKFMGKAPTLTEEQAKELQEYL